MFIQISQFLDESGYFRGGKFTLEGKNVQVQLRDEVRRVKKQYQVTFRNPIPSMSSEGRLIFADSGKSQK